MSIGLKESSSKQYVSTTLKYVEVMKAHGRDHSVISYMNLMVYAVHVLTIDKSVTTAGTVKSAFSHIEKMGPRMVPPLRRLTEGEDEFDAFCASMVKRYPPGGQKRELAGMERLYQVRLAMLTAVEALRAAALEGRRSGADVDVAVARIELTWRVLLTYYNGLLRLNELLKLRLSDVEDFEERGADACDGVILSLWDTKTGNHKVPIRRLQNDFDCVDYIRATKAERLRRGATPEALLFDMRELGYAPSAAEAAPTAELRRWLAAAGVPASQLPLFVCHSLRHGRTTDLLDWDVPPARVAKLGRWESMVWFTTYFHCTRLLVKGLNRVGLDSTGMPVFDLPLRRL